MSYDEEDAHRAILRCGDRIAARIRRVRRRCRTRIFEPVERDWSLPVILSRLNAALAMTLALGLSACATAIP
ncbi:MAG: hypothetical protein K2X25_10925, partial [Caulobacteraceae bacterium]|nr:hypothetical protein [Caulobacteraceae bacterium]